MSSPAARGLTCEYLADPLGLPGAAPRFSWVPEHPRRGATQTAYQVIVSPERRFIEKEVGDYWDSGQVKSEKNSGILYEGLPLFSGKAYFWRVRWWDDEGSVGSYSAVASFEMGLLQERDWKARWIGRKEESGLAAAGRGAPGRYPADLVQSLGVYLRKEFEVPEKIRRARIYVCGLGAYELRLNGRKIGDRVLDPAQTDYRKIALYSVYDVTTEVQEKNAVAVILGNGRHVKSYGYDGPKLILQVHLERLSELVERVVTDESWKVSSGPVLENDVYGGERHDARLAKQGWDRPGFDDSDWENAVNVPGPPLLAPQLLPPIRVAETLNPARTWSPRPGIHICDFGQNFSGWVRLKARGSRGTEIRVRHAELVDEEGSINVLPNRNAAATDVYILRGEGEEILEPRFSYHGFRYAEISGYPGEPAVGSVEGCFVHTDVPKAGFFECSSPLFNEIHRNVIRSQLSNLMSIPTDCPQRDERYGWLGDAHLSAEEAILNFDMAAFYTKFLDDIRFAQSDEGSLPDVVPPYLDGLYPADPAWGIAYLELARLMHFYYDDDRILQKHYGGMKKYVDYLTRNAEDNIIRRLGKYGDWCPPGSIVPKKVPLEFTSTWSYFRAARLLSSFARALGRLNEQRDYGKLAEEIKESLNARFLGEDEYAALRVGPADRSPCQTSNLLPLALDMVPAEKKDKVFGRLLDSVVRECDYHPDTGIIGTRYLLEVLTANGRADAAYRIVAQRSYPGWGYMVAEGATTLWERWEKLTGGGMNSHNHIMLGSVDTWFYRAAAGLRCTAPGWRKMAIRPELFAQLDWASAAIRTIRGLAEVTWKKSDGDFLLTARIPLGAEAEIYIPGPAAETEVWEGDQPLWPVNASGEMPREIKFLRREGPWIVFLTASGSYEFRSRMPEKT